MNKINKARKGEVRIYKGMTYVAVPEIKEDHCTGCCFYNEGSCLIRDPDHVDFPDCHDSGMIWMQKEINISDIKEKAIKLAIDAMKPIPICSSPCYSISDNRSPEEKHEEEMRFCKDLNDLRCEMLIDMAKKTGMIDQYMDYIKFINDNVDEENKIIYDTIMMIGDASGKEGQFSDSDKKTAGNFGCEYMDVDDFVYKYNNR